MRVLDIDLDFFLDGIVHRPQGNRRPKGLKPWSPDDVRSFLEQNCGLVRSDRIPAARFNTHDELFDLWREQIATGLLEAPFEVVHVDAHPDLGLGTAAHMQILTELLHLEPEDRQHPSRGGHTGLTEASFLAFAVACRWISSIEYVHHPKGSGNVPGVLFRDHDFHSGVIEMPCLPADTTMFRNLRGVLRLEPPVPYTEIKGCDYREAVGFDFAYLTKSPRYTPRSADALLPVFGEYLSFH